MLKIFKILIPIAIIYILIVKRVKIKFKTFFEKGFKPNKNIYGIYCYCGKQGSGKTLSITAYCNDKIDNLKSKDILYMNLQSYNKKDYVYIKDLKDLLKLRCKTDIVIVFDEIFTEITKLSKLEVKTMREVMDFLSQMRKRRIILLTSCQEWRLLPLYFRLYCRYQINCRMIRLPFIGGIIIKNVIDGDNIKWDDEEQDFVGELVENVIEHTRLSVANSYDTFETISDLNKPSDLPSTPIILSDTIPIDLPQANANLSEYVATDTQVDAKKEIDFDFWNELTPKDFIEEKKKLLQD